MTITLDYIRARQQLRREADLKYRLAYESGKMTKQEYHDLMTRWKHAHELAWEDIQILLQIVDQLPPTSLDDSENLSTRYEVRFTCYNYNSGAADNGYYHCEKEFQNSIEAQSFAAKLQKMLDNKEDTSDFADSCVPYSGFLESVDGVFEIKTVETEVQWQF